MLLGKKFAKTFIYAHKYERLKVLKQFVPYYNFQVNDSTAYLSFFNNYLASHTNKYGNNLIVESSRIPKNDYTLIDKKYFSKHKIKYSMEPLVRELFFSAHENLGFIDFPNI